MAQAHWPHGTGIFPRAPRASRSFGSAPDAQQPHRNYAQGYQAQVWRDPDAVPEPRLTRKARDHGPRDDAAHWEGEDVAPDLAHDDDPFDDAHAAPRRGAGAGALSQALGAVVSLGLVIGVSVWGYQLIMRDVSGVPVVRATEGPMRVAPDTPGGTIAPHQGFAVNEVAGGAAAGAPAEELRLAPPPVELTEEDAPSAALRWAAPGEAAASETDAASGGATAAAPGREVPVPEDAAIQALADQIAAGLSVGAAGAAGLPGADGVTAGAISGRTPTAASGGPVSLIPPTRPARLVNAAAPGAVAVPLVAPVTDLDPASLPPGTRLVQLGAYDSPEIAQREWVRIAGRFDAFFQDRARVIEPAEAGGRVFYRLRAAGFDDLGDARRFCAALMAERTDCIPVVTR